VFAVMAEVEGQEGWEEREEWADCRSILHAPRMRVGELFEGSFLWGLQFNCISLARARCFSLPCYREMNIG
jgi:hypothetical protein